MAAFNLSAADPLMKIVFAPRIPKQFNSAAVLYNDIFPGKGIPISNRGFEIPNHVGPDAGDSWPGDGGVLPAGDSNRLVRASVGFFTYSRALQFTGAALDAAGDDAATYARALAFNVRNAVVNAIKMLNIYAFGDGTGVLGKSGGAVTPSTTTTWTLDASGTGDGQRYLRVGQNLDFLTGVTTPVKVTATVNALADVIAFPGGAAPINVTMNAANAATALATGDGFVLSGSLNSVISGLKAIIDDGTTAATFQTITRSSNPQYKAKIITLTGSPAMSRDVLHRALANIQVSRGVVNLNNIRLWSHPGQLHAYADMGWTLKRFMGGNAMKLDLGFTAYEWEGIPWIVDTDCQRDTVWFVDRDSLLKVTARELSFDDRPGSILRQVPSSTAGQYNDAFVAYLLFRGNIGAYAPNANSAVIGLAVPTGY